MSRRNQSLNLLYKEMYLNKTKEIVIQIKIRKKIKLNLFDSKEYLFFDGTS